MGKVASLLVRDGTYLGVIGIVARIQADELVGGNPLCAACSPADSIATENTDAVNRSRHVSEEGTGRGQTLVELAQESSVIEVACLCGRGSHHYRGKWFSRFPDIRTGERPATQQMTE